MFQSALPILGPGIFFLVLGYTVIAAPSLLRSLLGGFFLFLGVLFVYLAYKFIQLRHSAERLFRNLERGIAIRAFKVGQNETNVVETNSSNIAELWGFETKVDKKIILH